MDVLGTLRTLAIFLTVFTLIIAVHEFGHYITARLLGMKVLEFAFGFPPRAVGIRHAEIDYTLNWIPFGGFVRILGQDDFSIKQQGEGDPRAFASKPWWAQAIVLVAGVTMNFILALVVLTAAFAMGTTGPTGEVRVADRGVAPGSPAEVAGFQPGDIVLSVDGRKVSNTRELIQYTRRNVEKEIALEVTRNGRPAAVLISPDDLDSLEETLELLGSQTAINELRDAQAAVASGDVVRGVDAVRALRPPRIR